MVRPVFGPPPLRFLTASGGPLCGEDRTRPTHSDAPKRRPPQIRYGAFFLSARGSMTAFSKFQTADFEFLHRLFRPLRDADRRKPLDRARGRLPRRGSSVPGIARGLCDEAASNLTMRRTGREKAHKRKKRKTRTASRVADRLPLPETECIRLSPQKRGLPGRFNLAITCARVGKRLGGGKGIWGKGISGTGLVHREVE